VFLSCKPFVFNTTFSTGLVGVEVFSVSWFSTITIIIDLKSNCQLPKSGDRSNFNTHKTRLKCCINDERPTGKKHKTVGWDEGGKIGKIIN